MRALGVVTFVAALALAPVAADAREVAVERASVDLSASNDARPDAPVSSTGTSPAPTRSFAGLGDNGTAIPPDTQGAVGPDHLLVALNTQIRIQTRDGAVMSTVILESFWNGLGITNAFDPRVLYDPYSNRWIVASVAERRDAASSVLLGVSATSDPTGAWNLYKFDADAGNTEWADYPIIGFNKDWIVVTVNMFTVTQPDTFQRSLILVVDKADVYAGGAGRVTRLLDDGSPGRSSLAPAVTYDAALPVIYLVANRSSSAGQLVLRSISGSVGGETLSSASTIQSPENWAFNPTPNADSLPQNGTTTTIDGGDARVQNCAYRNGSIWCAHTIFLTDPARAAVQWWQIGTDATVLQRGRIDDPAASVERAYPSIAVNRNNAVLIGYSRFSSSTYASAAYSFRASSDPANSMQDEQIVKTGEAPYRKTLGSSSVRWGDYSSTVPDPLNDVDMWTLQEYAETPVGSSTDDDRWGTWWVKVGTPSVAFGSAATTFNEGEGTATLTVTRTGDTGAAGTVAYATHAITATSGSDYTDTNGTLSFAANQTDATITIPIAGDAVAERLETFGITLSSPSSGMMLGSPSEAVVTIRDDEAPVLRFSTASASVNEGQTRAIVVERLGDPTPAVTVSYGARDGSARAPGDYRPTTGVLTFDPGEETGTVTITTEQDAIREPNETITVSLTDPSGATLGSPSDATLVVLASDQRPDALVRYSADRTSLGNNIYNTTASSQTRSVTAPRRTSRTFYVQMQNDGNAPSAFTLRGSGSSTGFTIRYFSGSTDITGRVVRGTYSSGTLSPGAARTVRLVVTIGSGATLRSVKSCLITVTWTGDVVARDAVKARVSVSS